MHKDTVLLIHLKAYTFSGANDLRFCTDRLIFFARLAELFIFSLATESFQACCCDFGWEILGVKLLQDSA